MIGFGLRIHTRVMSQGIFMRLFGADFIEGFKQAKFLTA